MTEFDYTIIVVTFLAGLCKLHSCKIAHRDIKATNILLKDNGEAVIIDFNKAIQLPLHDEDCLSVVSTLLSRKTVGVNM